MANDDVSPEEIRSDNLVERLVADIIRDVVELPDRDSPDDWPDAMLVTSEELGLIVQRNLSDRIEQLERDGATVSKKEIVRQRDAAMDALLVARDALKPFASPPLYVFDSDRLYAPMPCPADWIGGGLVSTAEYRTAPQALSQIDRILWRADVQAATSSTGER